MPSVRWTYGTPSSISSTCGVEYLPDFYRGDALERRTDFYTDFYNDFYNEFYNDFYNDCR